MTTEIRCHATDGQSKLQPFALDWRFLNEENAYTERSAAKLLY